MKNRRDFLKMCASVAMLGGAGRLLHAQGNPNFKALICVFQFGGNDGNNVVVPMDSAPYAQYAAGRGGVALSAGSLLPIQAQGKAFGLHPRFTDLAPLYAQGRMAMLANVGTLVRPVTKAMLSSSEVPRNLYSHSDQTQQWQTSNPLGTGGTGWGGRAADALSRSYPSLFTPAISVAGNSLFLTGQTTTPANISGGSAFGLDTIDESQADDVARRVALENIMTFDTGVTLVGPTSNVLLSGIRNAAKVQQALQNAPVLTTAFPTTGLGNQLKQVAQLIAVHQALGMSRQIFFVSQGGYDNHSDLLNSQFGRFAELSPALAAFYRATVELNLAQNVTAFTESEFGRTFDPSSTAGSDHAWGSHHMIVGGAVRGGQMYGTFPTLALRGPDDAGSRGQWIPTTSLDQYGATLASWFGVQAVDLPQVFPNLANFATKNLGFI